MIQPCEKGNVGYYLSLSAILLSGVVFLMYSQDVQVRVLVVVMTAIFYAGWGILHHRLHHDITAKIVVEYVLISSLGMTVVLFLLKGGAL